MDKRILSKNTSYQTATFAGGCFWCMEPVFRLQPGVKEVIVGYAGGDMENPTYDDVSTGHTGHKEAFQITYDPNITEYYRLLQIFWRNIDPTDDGGQFHDRGNQYQTAIFFHNEDQRKIAEASKAEMAASGRFDAPIATAILPFTNFFPAEDYHQRYSQKNPVRYELYHQGSGRADYKKRIWGKEK